MIPSSIPSIAGGGILLLVVCILIYDANKEGFSNTIVAHSGQGAPRNIAAYQAAGYDFSLLSIQNSDNLQVGELQSQILDYNNSEFKDQFGPSINASTSAINTGRLVGRNASLSDISQKLIDQNKQTMNTYTKAKDTYSRQGEINEWQAQNKLDTLFFLQILFLYFSLVVFLLYLRQADILSGNTVYTTVLVLLIIIIGIFWNRVSYTNINRDSRYWNRRYISSNPDLAKTTAESQCEASPMSTPSRSPSSQRDMVNMAYSQVGGVLANASKNDINTVQNLYPKVGELINMLTDEDIQMLSSDFKNVMGTVQKIAARYQGS